MENLKYKINKVAFEIVKKIENMKKEGDDWKKYRNEIDKVLGVLANDGVYAYWIYCKSKDIDWLFIKKLEDLMEYTRTEMKNNNYEEYFQNLSKDINDLLFFKEILEKTLIYARYHAKALGD